MFSQGHLGLPGWDWASCPLWLELADVWGPHLASSVGLSLFLLLGMVGTCEGPCEALAGSSDPLGLMAQALRCQTHT